MKMKLIATFLLILILEIAFGNDLPQKTVNEINAQKKKVEAKISADRSLTVDGVLCKSKNATDAVLSREKCDVKSMK